MSTMTIHPFAAAALAIAMTSCLSTAFAHGADGAAAVSSGGSNLLVQGGQLGKAVFPDGNTARGGQGQPVDGIEGSSQEMLKTHFHAHLAIFYKGEQIAVPRGIGIIAPLRIEHGFVGGGQGFYWLHTHDASGILHVESPNDRVYTLGNFFDVWGQPLSAENVAGLKGALRVYVNGKVQFAPVREISLKPHDQIALVIGQPSVVPVTYTFPDEL